MEMEECPPEEEVLRAIRRADWDKKKNRYSSGLFKGRDVSISRLRILSYSEILKIFRADFDDRPTGPLEGTGQINVGHLQKIGINYKANPTKLTVVPKPLEGNRAHAEIPQNISKGLAREIIDALKVTPV